ncbi:MAG: MFS transporter [Candidatus Pacearchaeota archaeon]|nr:MFS transporter [Candidatus Pacearchaeota archaeon]
MNRTLKLLIASDSLVFTGFGLVAPILAVYLKNSIGGSLEAIGLMTTLFLVSKTVFQLLFSKVFEPKQRFFMVCVGTLMIALVPFIYLFSSQMWHFYIAQVLYGIGGGLAYPAWFSLFSSNLTKGKQGFEWSVYSGLVGLGAAVSASIGSILANKWGFNLVFFLAGVVSIIGMLILLGLERNNLKRILPSEMFVNKHKPVH